MAKRAELDLEDFTEVSRHIEKALDGINTIYTSSVLTDEEKARLGSLGRALHSTGHDLDHLFLVLRSVPEKLMKQLQAHYGH